VSGWGSTAADTTQNQFPTDLQYVQVPLVAQQVCRDQAPFFISDNYICAGQSGKDSCIGDSGGPMSVNYNGIEYQIGVISTGTQLEEPLCDGIYGVYTRVIPFVSWIEQSTGPLNPIVTTGSLSTGAVTSSPLTTSPLTTSPLTTGFVPCTLASDCNGAFTDDQLQCNSVPCHSGHCELDPFEEGRNARHQVNGNCQKEICTNGVVTLTPYDLDRPADANPCTRDECSNGTPVFIADDGRSCSDCGSIGYGCRCVSAVCVARQCSFARDCGSDTACQATTCTDGVCGWRNKSEGALCTENGVTNGRCSNGVCTATAA
jgi:hypothetical protein